ncbi:MAG: helix-turn-helix domain-containing protein [Bradymonadia bacterium]
MSETYTTVAGEKITYDAPEAPIMSFLLEVMHTAADPKVSTMALYDLVHGVRNPILRQGVVPGRGIVTDEAYDDPVYRIMLDQIALKRIARGDADTSTEGAKIFNLSVSEAAEIIGISPQGVRNSLSRGSWPYVRKDGRMMMAIEDAERWRDKHQNRGAGGSKTPGQAEAAPSGALQVRLGNVKGLSFFVKNAAPDLANKRADGRHVHCGEIPEGWQRIAVKRAEGKKSTMFVLEPGPEEAEIEWKGFYVRGRFTITQKINNAREISAAWKAFEPA